MNLTVDVDVVLDTDYDGELAMIELMYGMPAWFYTRNELRKTATRKYQIEKRIHEQDKAERLERAERLPEGAEFEHEEY